MSFVTAGSPSNLAASGHSDAFASFFLFNLPASYSWVALFLPPCNLSLYFGGFLFFFRIPNLTCSVLSSVLARRSAYRTPPSLLTPFFDPLDTVGSSEVTFRFDFVLYCRKVFPSPFRVCWVWRLCLCCLFCCGGFFSFVFLQRVLPFFFVWLLLSGCFFLMARRV